MLIGFLFLRFFFANFNTNQQVRRIYTNSENIATQNCSIKYACIKCVLWCDEKQLNAFSVLCAKQQDIYATKQALINGQAYTSINLNAFVCVHPVSSLNKSFNQICQYSYLKKICPMSCNDFTLWRGSSSCPFAQRIITLVSINRDFYRNHRQFCRLSIAMHSKRGVDYST